MIKKQTRIVINDLFQIREINMLQRIQKHYMLKLQREVTIEEAKEIASNLLAFAKTIYGV